MSDNHGTGADSSLDFSLLNAAVANLCATAITPTAKSAAKAAAAASTTVPTTPTPTRTDMQQLHSPSPSASSLVLMEVAAAGIAGADDAAAVGLSRDIMSENYWLREKLQEIQSDRDRLMCEVANLRLELDMGELKRLPEHW